MSISSVVPIAAGNALRVFLAPPTGAVSWRVLRKATNDIVDQDDPAATIVYSGADVAPLDYAVPSNGTPFYYQAFDWDGAYWTPSNVVSAAAAVSYGDATTDVMTLVRDRVDFGLRAEIAAGRLHPTRGTIKVLTAPPEIEGVQWPVVTVHLQNESPISRGLGEMLEEDEVDPGSTDWIESEGWLAKGQLAIMAWSQNPDERIELRKALRRIMVANLQVFDAVGMVQVDIAQQDMEMISGEMPAPVYQSLCTLSYQAPVRIVIGGASAILDVVVTNPDTVEPPKPGVLPRLGVVGKTIVGPDGRPIRLRGWNWGFWGAAQAQDGADNAAQGANIIRIPLRWWGLFTDQAFEARDDNSPGNIDPAHLVELDRMLDLCEANGLWAHIFIDSQCGENGLAPGVFGGPESLYCDPQQLYPNGRSFLADQTQAAKFVETWVYIANHVKNRRCIGLFEPLVEANPIGFSDANLITFYDRVMSAIRAAAPGIPFLVGGRSYFTNNISHVYHAAWKDVIYTADVFVPDSGTHDQNIAALDGKVASMTALRDSKNVPVLANQTGVTSRDDPDFSYTRAVLSRLNDADVPWEWWEYRDSHTDGGGFGVKYPDGQGGWLTKDEFLAVITGYMQQA